MKIAYHPSFPEFLPERHCAFEGASFRSASAPGELADLARESDALLMLATDYTAELARSLQRPECRLRLIQFLSAGYESAQDSGVPRGVAVCNANEVWAPMVAEHTVAMVLGLMRRFADLERMRQARQWDRDTVNARLRSLDGARAAILGYGTIGREIARRMRPFGAEIIGVSRSARRCEIADETVTLSGFDDLLPDLDILVNVLPSTPDTRCFINGQRLARMKRSAYFVNVGRGATVDEVALVDCLQAGGIAGAGLDVFQEEPLPDASPLWSLANVILSPHAAGYGSHGIASRAHALCRDNLMALQQGRALRNEVTLAPDEAR